jgi:DNA-binding FadR family transcriptional regulator
MPRRTHNSLSVPRSKNGKLKLAQRIAKEIESRIVVEGWPVGHPLGTEADWSEALQASRWTVREALALLEQTGVVESRRGRYGGLFVAASLGDAVRNSLSNYLEFIRIRPAYIREIRRALERVQTLIASAQPPVGPASLEATAAIRQTLLMATRNPALELFVSALSRAMLHASWYSSLDDAAFVRVMEGMMRSTCVTAQSVIQGKPAIALNAEDEFLVHFEAVYGASALSGRASSISHALERADRMFPAGRPPKKPEQIARRIMQTIIESDWPVGTNLGSQPELMAHYQVGRAVLREAIRSLERLGVVEAGRGGNSGLRVISPDPAEIVAACQRFLRRSGTTPEQAEVVRRALSPSSRSSADRGGKTLSDNPLAKLLLLILRESR